MINMKTRLKLLDKEMLECASECLKLLGHPVRLRIVDILTQGRFSVNEIAEICDLPQNQVSEHLRLMKGHGLLDFERDGRTVYYKIENPNLPGILNCVKANCKNKKGK